MAFSSVLQPSFSSIMTRGDPDHDNSSATLKLGFKGTPPHCCSATSSHKLFQHLLKFSVCPASPQVQEYGASPTLAQAAACSHSRSSAGYPLSSGSRGSSPCYRLGTASAGGTPVMSAIPLDIDADLHDAVPSREDSLVASSPAKYRERSLSSVPSSPLNAIVEAAPAMLDLDAFPSDKRTPQQQAGSASVDQWPSVSTLAAVAMDGELEDLRILVFRLYANPCKQQRPLH